MITRKRRAPISEHATETAIRHLIRHQIFEHARQAQAIARREDHHPGIVEDQLAVDPHMQFRDRLEQQASQITGLERAADAAELKRQLEIELEEDLGALRDELQMAKGEALLSRDVVVTAAVGALAAGGRIADVWGGTAAAITGGLSLAAGLMGTRLKYAKERRTILER